MSAPLTSLLVRDHVVPVKKIEEAIQRQVISGGELATALLELGAVPENVITAYSAASVGLAPTTRDDVMNVPREVVRIVPREVAEQHRLVPVASEGRALVLAAARPLASEVLRQLEFLLGMEITVRIASDVRIAAALSSHYGLEMAPRMRRLAERLGQQDAGILPEIAPFDANVAKRPDDSRNVAGSSYERPTAAEANRANPAPSMTAASARPLVTASGRTPTSTSPERPAARPSPAPASLGTSAAAAKGATPAPKNAAPVARSFPPIQGRTPEPPAPAGPPRSELVKKHRGPMSAQIAVELLGKAETRDDILAVSFAFMRQFFDYTVMFVVHDDLAEGLDAFGRGASWEKVQQVAGSLSEAGAMKQVAELLVPRVSQLDETPADERLSRQLGRASYQPCLILPVAIRQRVVVLFYGDRGGEDFGLADVPEPLGFVPRVSEALQRLILRRKQRAAGEGPAGATEPPKGGKAAGASAWPAAGSKAVKSASVAPAPRAPVASPRAPGAPSAPATMPGRAIEPGPKRAASPTSGAIPTATTPGEPARSPHLAVLGVPRDAPPPPLVRRTIAVGEPAAPAPPPFRGEPPRAFVRPAAPAKPAAASEPEPALDDEPEITVDEPDSEEIAEIGSAQRAGSYSQRGGFTDVVVSRKPSLDAVEPPPASVSRGARERAPSPSLSKDDSGDEGGDPALRSTVPMVDVPKVIVSMGDSVESVVRDLAFASREAADAHVKKVLEVGPAALPMLVQAFPGPVWNARSASSAPTTVRELSPVALALAAFGEAAAPYLVTLFADEAADIRYYALVTAESLVHRDLVGPLGVRLFDHDDAVSTLAMQLLRKHRRFQREYQEVLDKVRSTARSPRVSERRRALALEALGELRDARSIRALLQFLEQGPERLARAAHKSLVALTRQDFGDSAQRWQPWVDEHGRKHRIEWLIDALLHPEQEQRRLASDELKQLTQEYFGYHHALPRKERELAQRKYRAWWEGDGQRKFAAT